MNSEERFRPTDNPAAQPLLELLACPLAISSLFSASIRNISFQSGEIIFHQSESSKGLYLVVNGKLIRRAQQQKTWLALGAVHPGNLIELAAVLGERGHSCSLIAQSAGSLLLLPAESLQQAFRAYPPLRMRLLGELAREVSHAYYASARSAESRIRRRVFHPRAAG